MCACPLFVSCCLLMGCTCSDDQRIGTFTTCKILYKVTDQNDSLKNRKPRRHNMQIVAYFILLKHIKVNIIGHGAIGDFLVQASVKNNNNYYYYIQSINDSISFGDYSFTSFFPHSSLSTHYMLFISFDLIPVVTSYISEF